ncbi:MAG TPA: helix-turn-helix transcriptional regulator [Xanthobacteraceae bacterium]
MRESHQFLGTVEAVHAAGLDGALWPRALAAIADAVGGSCASLETFDKQTLRHRGFLTHGLPPAGEIAYLEHYAALNLRVPAHAGAKLGELIWDYKILDEGTMARAPFYAEFLPGLDLRYLIAGVIHSSKEEFAAVTVQRSPKQGHVDQADIAAMRHLTPHVRQAFDVARRLKLAGAVRHCLERALDWLADGVALVAAGGKLTYVNEAFRAIAQRNDGITLAKGVIEFAGAEARTRFEAAIGSVNRLRAGDPLAAGVSDFPVARSSGAQTYLVSVRPLLERGGNVEGESIAIVFIRDPLGRSIAAPQMMRELFGFTESEASLAQALQSGMSLADYARSRAVSLNTVYTHLRRIREKTGCTRMTELIRKLNDLQVSLRLD